MATVINEHEQLELRLLFQVLQELYGFDLSEYRESYLIRRVNRRMSMDKLSSITMLTNSIIHNEQSGRNFIQDISINVTSMFRFPIFYRYLRDQVFPILKTYPSIRIWHAGCASGEEVLSLAILLKEGGLYEKSTILATDINDLALKTAKEAMYSSDSLKQWTRNYNKAGGLESFADYFDVKYNQALFDRKLLQNVTFQHHDLTKDEYPKNIHLLLCRNVLIYFNASLQQKVLEKFHQSLRKDGYLGIGDKEHVGIDSPFKTLEKHCKVYQK